MKQKKQIVILSAVCLVCVVCMVLALTVGRKTVVQFDPPPFEASAMAGVPENVPNTSYGALNTTAYSLSACGQPTVTDGTVQLWLTNPSDNKVLLKMRILDMEGTLLGESGLLRPGEYVQGVTLSTPITEDTDIILLIMAYEPETYHSAGNIKLQTTLVVGNE